MRGRIRGVVFFLAAGLGLGLLWNPAALAKPDPAETGGGHLLRLLRYAPADSQVVHYANMIGLERAIGADVTGLDDVPVPADSPGAPLTPREEIGRAWSWDINYQIPLSSQTGVAFLPTGAWDRLFGF